jgi:hypothetical protein
MGVATVNAIEGVARKFAPGWRAGANQGPDPRHQGALGESRGGDGFGLPLVDQTYVNHKIDTSPADVVRLTADLQQIGGVRKISSVTVQEALRPAAWSFSRSLGRAPTSPASGGLPGRGVPGGGHARAVVAWWRGCVRVCG